MHDYNTVEAHADLLSQVHLYPKHKQCGTVKKVLPSKVKSLV